MVVAYLYKTERNDFQHSHSKIARYLIYLSFTILPNIRKYNFVSHIGIHLIYLVITHLFKKYPTGTLR